jgi:hypothetical protein
MLTLALDKLQDHLRHRFSPFFTDLFESSFEFVGDLRDPESTHFLIVASFSELSRNIPQISQIEASRGVLPMLEGIWLWHFG